MNSRTVVQMRQVTTLPPPDVGLYMPTNSWLQSPRHTQRSEAVSHRTERGLERGCLPPSGARLSERSEAVSHHAERGSERSLSEAVSRCPSEERRSPAERSEEQSEAVSRRAERGCLSGASRRRPPSGVRQFESHHSERQQLQGPSSWATRSLEARAVESRRSQNGC